MEIKSYGENIYTQLGWQGKTLSWCPADSEERFNENMANAKTRAQLEQHGWTRDSISYVFNEHGFRADEFTGGVNDSVLFLGCSLTMGIGMTLEDTWAYKVASSLGLRRYNLGVGGGGPDMCFRLAYHWIPRLKPKYVVMLVPNAARMELVREPFTEQYQPNMKTTEQFYNRWLEHPANADMNLLKCSLGVRSICDSNSVPLIETFVNDRKGVWSYQNAKDRGRDLDHPGRTWNSNVATAILEKIGA